MATKIRMRCPGCGMLVDQERLNGVHDFEIIVHEIGSRGRGKIYNVYRKPNKVEGNAFFYFKIGLAAKFREIADRLEGNLRDEVDTEDDADEMVVDAEYEVQAGGDEVWHLEDVEPETVLELTPETVVEITPRTVLED